MQFSVVYSPSCDACGKSTAEEPDQMLCRWCRAKLPHAYQPTEHGWCKFCGGMIGERGSVHA